MTTYLDFQGQSPRVETDAEIIATLLRKGWTQRPPLPEYDPQTQQVTWDGSQWVVSAVQPPVPDSVPAHHLRRALREAGLRAQVDALIASLPEDHPMREDWEYAPHFRRDALGIEQVRQALGLTQEQVDDVFRAAGAVQT
jgi:hypothetical protein